MVDRRLPSMYDSLKTLYNAAWPTPELHYYLRKHCLQDKLADIEAHCSVLTVALCTAFEGPMGMIFRFDPHGVPSIVIAAHDSVRERPNDLVAWPLHGSDPDNFATFRLEADVLGAGQMCDQIRQKAGNPLRLHRHPQDWIASGFDGSVLLNQRWGGYWLNKVKGPFIAADLDHGREVAAMLRPFKKSHLVMIEAHDADQKMAA